MPVRACVGYCAPVRPLVPLTPRLTHPAPSRDILLLPIVTHPTRARLEPVAALRGTSPPGSPARRRSGSGAIVPLVIFLFWLFSVFRPTGSHHCVFYPISVYPGMPHSVPVGPVGGLCGAFRGAESLPGGHLPVPSALWAIVHHTPPFPSSRRPLAPWSDHPAPIASHDIIEGGAPIRRRRWVRPSAAHCRAVCRVGSVDPPGEGRLAFYSRLLYFSLWR
jgi:hypothetical protein